MSTGLPSIKHFHSLCLVLMTDRSSCGGSMVWGPMFASHLLCPARHLPVVQLQYAFHLSIVSAPAVVRLTSAKFACRYPGMGGRHFAWTRQQCLMRHVPRQTGKMQAESPHSKAGSKASQRHECCLNVSFMQHADSSVSASHGCGFGNKAALCLHNRIDPCLNIMCLA